MSDKDYWERRKPRDPVTAKNLTSITRDEAGNPIGSTGEKVHASAQRVIAANRKLGKPALSRRVWWLKVKENLGPEAIRRLIKKITQTEE